MTTLNEPARATAAKNANVRAVSTASTRLRSLAHRATSALDRPGGRWLLALPGSVWVTTKHRRPCLVHWSEGAWIHHYRGAKIPHAQFGRAAPPDVFTADAREIFLYGYVPRSGDVVFDVGAGIGAETLVFSGLVGPSGRVVSLEAHPRTFARLQRLCRENRLANVDALQVAAASRDGELFISDDGNHLQNTVLPTDGARVSVAAKTLDTVARELGVKRVDLLKMNIEGAERLAIAGMNDVIANTRHVCISCHDFLAENGGGDAMRTKATVRAFLVANGFRVTTRDDASEPWTRDYLYGVNTRIG